MISDKINTDKLMYSIIFCFRIIVNIVLNHPVSALNVPPTNIIIRAVL